MGACQTSETNTLNQGVCPPESWGHLASDSDYQEKGRVHTLDGGLRVYRVGEAQDGRCVVWNYDIHGFKGGRTRQLCDWIAEKGFLVLLPDYFRGDVTKPDAPSNMNFLVEKSQWNNLKKDWEDAIVPYAKKHGAEIFGVIGTCWGSYCALRQSSYPYVKAGVCMHPGHSKLCGLVSVSEEDILKQVQCVQLFLTAKNDDASVKPGGLDESVLDGDGKGLIDIVEFPEMLHGWTCRGDITDDDVRRDVVIAMTLAADFLERHVH